MTTSVQKTQAKVIGALVWGCATVVLAAASAEQVSGSDTIVVAQLPAPVPSLNSVPVPEEAAYPAYQRGVRAAAAEGNDALRRYIWRTRGIYNFYFDDFAKKG